DTALAEMRSKRNSRNERIVDMLQKQGVGITMDDVMKEAGGESVGRPHIAMALMARGYVPTIGKAFDRYLGPTGSAYLPKEVMDPEKAVSLMSSVGCSVIIAHPMLKPYPPGWIEEFVKRLLPFGLCGIEAWHSEHTDEDSKSVLAIARRYHLCVSGGSDYHGQNKPRIMLGTGYGSLCVSTDAFALLKQWREEHHLPC
ncbi:MAG: phosphatase, partial [Desulfovibrionaceae bacterium]|nr:phosphatase [Desulfovibrionaceae bacterium]